MADLIDRDKLIGDLEKLRQGCAVADRVLDLAIDKVKAQPAAEVKKETFLDWRTAAADKEKKRRESLIPIYDIIEHTHSGLLEED
jgi:hypothetical protein